MVHKEIWICRTCLLQPRFNFRLHFKVTLVLGGEEENPPAFYLWFDLSITVVLDLLSVTVCTMVIYFTGKEYICISEDSSSLSFEIHSSL